MTGVGPCQQIFFDGEVFETVPTLHDLNHASALHKYRRGLASRKIGTAIADGAFGNYRRAQISASNPEMAFKVVVALPAPLPPSKAAMPPLGTRQADALQHKDHVVVDHFNVADLEQVPLSVG